MIRLLSTSAGEQTVVATVPYVRCTSVLIHVRAPLSSDTDRCEARREMARNVVFKVRRLE